MLLKWTRRVVISAHLRLKWDREDRGAAEVGQRIERSVR
jgi:hypothetical protein